MMWNLLAILRLFSQTNKSVSMFLFEGLFWQTHTVNGRDLISFGCIIHQMGESVERPTVSQAHLVRAVII